MDFFKSQENARQNTTVLVLLFILAVACMIVLTNLLVMFSLGYFDPESLVTEGFNWEISMVVAVVIISLVFLGSAYKTIRLSGGGTRLAEQMNGNLVINDSGDPDKQRILNVVEEMAIASGVPVPPVYLLHEEGINAFAAGHNPSDAVIGVTRGAVQKLSRDELQGVIAHEFSHILNGDMRLNIRLIGILHGILILGMMGYYLLRFGPRSRDSKSGGGMVVLGLGLMVIGYAGTFFGNLIKAAVSRQREYLADSAAVQFTRNPEGIGGALIRIGEQQKGGILDNPSSREISHTLFCQGVKSSLLFLCATHPPLDQRIRRILPSWNGEFLKKEHVDPVQQQVKVEEERLRKEHAAILAGSAVILNKDEVVKRIGNPTEVHIDNARQLIKDLSPNLKRAAHSTYGAQALIYCLVLDEKQDELEKQLEYLDLAPDGDVNAEVLKLAEEVSKLPNKYRLALIDLALPTLRQLTTKQCRSFAKTLRGLVASDGSIDLFEWLLQKIVFRHLDKVFHAKKRLRKKVVSLGRLREASTILLSYFSVALKQEGVSQHEVFALAQEEIDWLDTDLFNDNSFTLQDLDLALDDLAKLKPQFKRSLIRACIAIVAADKYVSVEEVELLRAVADTLGCPMPRFI